MLFSAEAAFEPKHSGLRRCTVVLSTSVSGANTDVLHLRMLYWWVIPCVSNTLKVGNHSPFFVMWGIQRQKTISIYLVKLLEYVGWGEAQVVRCRILLERTPFGDI